VNHYPIQFIYKFNFKFFCIFSYPGNTDKQLAAKFFSGVLKGNNIRKGSMRKKFFIESKKKCIVAKREVDILRFLFFFLNYSQDQFLYSRFVRQRESNALAGKVNAYFRINCHSALKELMGFQEFCSIVPFPEIFVLH
jgi:hypothetical protein